ncbi:hypothetical protein EIN_376940, partial [Entamoeba invadens IP1]
MSSAIDSFIESLSDVNIFVNSSDLEVFILSTQFSTSQMNSLVNLIATKICEHDNLKKNENKSVNKIITALAKRLDPFVDYFPLGTSKDFFCNIKLSEKHKKLIEVLNNWGIQVFLPFFDESKFIELVRNSNINLNKKISILTNFVFEDKTLEKTFFESQKKITYSMCRHFDEIKTLQNIDENYFGTNERWDGIFLAIYLTRRKELMRVSVVNRIFEKFTQNSFMAFFDVLSSNRNTSDVTKYLHDTNIVDCVFKIVISKNCKSKNNLMYFIADVLPDKTYEIVTNYSQLVENATSTLFNTVLEFMKILVILLEKFDSIEDSRCDDLLGVVLNFLNQNCNFNTAKLFSTLVLVSPKYIKQRTDVFETSIINFVTLIAKTQYCCKRNQGLLKNAFCVIAQFANENLNKTIGKKVFEVCAEEHNKNNLLHIFDGMKCSQKYSKVVSKLCFSKISEENTETLSKVYLDLLTTTLNTKIAFENLDKFTQIFGMCSAKTNREALRAMRRLVGNYYRMLENQISHEIVGTTETPKLLEISKQFIDKTVLIPFQNLTAFLEKENVQQSGVVDLLRKVYLPHQLLSFINTTQQLPLLEILSQLISKVYTHLSNNYKQTKQSKPLIEFLNILQSFIKKDQTLKISYFNARFVSKEIRDLMNERCVQKDFENVKNNSGFLLITSVYINTTLLLNETIRQLLVSQKQFKRLTIDFPNSENEKTIPSLLPIVLDNINFVKFTSFIKLLMNNTLINCEQVSIVICNLFNSVLDKTQILPLCNVFATNMFLTFSVANALSKTVSTYLKNNKESIDNSQAEAFIRTLFSVIENTSGVVKNILYTIVTEVINVVCSRFEIVTFNENETDSVIRRNMVFLKYRKYDEIFPCLNAKTTKGAMSDNIKKMVTTHFTLSNIKLLLLSWYSTNHMSFSKVEKNVFSLFFALIPFNELQKAITEFENENERGDFKGEILISLSTFCYLLPQTEQTTCEKFIVTHFAETAQNIESEHQSAFLKRFMKGDIKIVHKCFEMITRGCEEQIYGKLQMEFILKELLDSPNEEVIIKLLKNKEFTIFSSTQFKTLLNSLSKKRENEVLIYNIAQIIEYRPLTALPTQIDPILEIFLPFEHSNTILPNNIYIQKSVITNFVKGVLEVFNNTSKNGKVFIAHLLQNIENTEVIYQIPLNVLFENSDLKTRNAIGETLEKIVKNTKNYDVCQFSMDKNSDIVKEHINTIKARIVLRQGDILLT